jgi:hypothetical protein
MSNNGDAEPIAYQRDITLSVGPVITSIITLTATITEVSIPIVSTTGKFIVSEMGI